MASYDEQASFIRIGTGNWEYPTLIDLGSESFGTMATANHHLLAGDCDVGLMVFLDQEILVDGFESGDTAAWQPLQPRLRVARERRSSLSP